MAPVLAALKTDAYGQLLLLSDQSKNNRRPIGLDEVERVPEITLALKRIVDSDRRPGQYVLTGSSDILTTAAAYDSLGVSPRNCGTGSFCRVNVSLS